MIRKPYSPVLQSTLDRSPVEGARARVEGS